MEQYIHTVIDQNIRQWSIRAYSPTGDKLSRIQGTKTKKSNFIYPTADILQKNYPKLYPTGPIPCVECKLANDSNLHVGLCLNTTTTSKQYYKDIKTLITLLTDNATGFTHDIADRVNISPLFNVKKDTNSPNGKRSIRDPLLIEYIKQFIHDLTQINNLSGRTKHSNHGNYPELPHNTKPTH
ncbi:hypothetical protein RhiirA5_504372 [Rhizophagus irregularis]|uniref:Uncharacterized protein n=1 Tax=Rhizophagus irregularis TaxID=588596 RepID=A0A2I1F670_9GLOM|nr:hypothetical protein RhiirA5_504372 [Rhizophagus irregularis]PKY29862.1 hypothetical protein RhiirB3_530740 [Rhizophagus irregularis]GET55903.1 hypothetical protein GLOIN_2v1763333 [Rhizophagus irregularis DAOM 181602=DAOM 197198]